MGALDIGKRDRLVVIEQRSVTKNGAGLAVESWAAAGRAWSNVRFGSGAERRAAAQEGSTQAATFGMLRNRLTAGLTPADHRLRMNETAWDITAVADEGRGGIVVTAVKGE